MKLDALTPLYEGELKFYYWCYDQMKEKIGSEKKPI